MEILINLNQHIYLLHFPENHITLATDSVLLKLRVLQDIRENVESLRDVLVQDLGVIRGLFPRSVGVQVASHVLNLLLQLARRPPLGSLEDHVLQEMRRPVRLLRLEPRTGVNPNPDRRRLRREVRLRRDSQAVRQRRDLGLRSRKDPSVVGHGRVGRPVLKEPWVGVLELLELRFDGLGEAVVDHGVRRRRRRRRRLRRGDRRRGRCGSNRLSQKGVDPDDGPFTGPPGYSGEEMLDRHGSDGTKL